MTTLNQLATVFDQLVEAQAPDIDNLPPGTDSIAWFRAQGFVVSRASMTGSVVGLPPGGLPAWLEFAGAVRAGDPRYARGTRLNPFVEQLFTEVVKLKRGAQGDRYRRPHSPKSRPRWQHSSRQSPSPRRT